MSESQLIEYKESWRDEYLKWICASFACQNSFSKTQSGLRRFANTQGGVLYIGKRDDGSVCGVTDSKKLMEDIPNKVRDALGLIVDVDLITENGLDVIKITVEENPYPVNYKGEYHYRTGSTKQLLQGSAKIRIIRYQYIVKEGTLFPEEVDQYDSFTIRESLNNCIAHQDYTKGCRINVIEGEDQLTFENAGLFIPNSVEQVVKDNSPESHYRDPFLATAMMNLNLVETAGGGIRKLFEIQKKKFFPLPEYELSADKVKVTFTGKIINMDLARKVAKNPDISFDELFAVDKVQKGNTSLKQNWNF